MAVQRFSPKRLGEGRCIALSSASAEDFQQGGITGSNRFCPPHFLALLGKEGGHALKVGMHPAEEGAYRGPKPAGWIRFWKEEFRLSKRLKLFGLLALTVALVVGVAWAADTLVLVGNGDSVFTLASAGPNDTNIITGNGTQRAGIVGAAGNEILRLNATEGNMVTIAPVAANVLPAPLNVIQRLSTAAPNNLQVVINANEERGKVVIKASAGDNPTAGRSRSEERRVGKECRSRWSPYH